MESIKSRQWWMMDSDGGKAGKPGSGFIALLKDRFSRLFLTRKGSDAIGTAQVIADSRAADPMLNPINEGAKAVGQAPKAGQISQSRMTAIEGAHGDRGQQFNKLRSVAKAMGVPESGKDAWFSKDQVVVPVSTGGTHSTTSAAAVQHAPRRNQRMTEARLTSTRLQALAEALEPKREE